MRAIRRAALAAIAIGLPAVPTLGHADDRYPMMDHDRAVVCARDKDGQVWRIQCDPSTKVCLYAADEELDADGPDAHAVIADLETWEGAEAVVSEALDRFGRIDVAIHNVGGTIWAKPLEHNTPAQIQA